MASGKNKNKRANTTEHTVLGMHPESLRNVGTYVTHRTPQFYSFGFVCFPSGDDDLHAIGSQ